MKELERQVVIDDSMRSIFRDTIWQREIHQPLFMKRFLILFVQVLLAIAAQQMLTASFLKSFPSSVSQPINPHHLVIIVVEVAI